MALRRRDLPEYDLAKPSAQTVAATTLRTQAALSTAIEGKVAVTKIGNEAMKPKRNDYYVGYDDKVIRMYDQQPDPMEPVKFKFRRVPRGPDTDKVPIERSPPRQPSGKVQKEWSVPPCISNWKNARGYTIPLDMRLSADGRYLKDLSVSNNFPKLTEALYAAEATAKEEIQLRQELRRKLTLKEAIAKEQEMRELADKAKQERLKLLTESGACKRSRSSSDDERAEIRYERDREVERQLRIERAYKKGRGLKDRDLAEQLALGQASIGRTTMFDQRLFNQNEGLDAGFGSEDEYDVYDRPLFSDRSAANIYRNVRNTNTLEVVPGQTRPVEFEQH